MIVRTVIDKEFVGLGDKIRRARKLDKRSLRQITEEVGMTPMNWYKIEKEETKTLPVETLKRIEEVLGVNLEVELEHLK